jgi:hypothetical protein
MSSPLSALPADVFRCIVKQVASRKRMRPNGHSSVQCRCQHFFEMRRELRTLALVPSQVVDPKYLCTDPNGALWHNAHIVFGIDPDAPGFGKLSRCSLRDNFLLLRAAFDPNLEYETWNDLDEVWRTVSVWDRLWESAPENTLAVSQWGDDAALYAYNAYVVSTTANGDWGEADDYDTWYDIQEDHDTLPKYPISEEAIVLFQSMLRPLMVDEALLKAMRARLRSMMHDLRADRNRHPCEYDGTRRVFLPPQPVRRAGRPAKYDWVGPTVRAQEEACVRKLAALKVLFRTMRRQQATAIGALAA